MAEPTPALRGLVKYRDQARQLDRKLYFLVAQARAEGATWSQIGEALDLTRQAVHQRFGKDIR